METRQYFGWRLTQRTDPNTVPLFVFYARAKDIHQWAGIRRIADFAEGTQRLLRPARQHAITRFLKADPVNTIPNSILVAFEPNRVAFTPLGEKIAACIPEVDFLNGCHDRLDWGFLEFSFESDEPEHLRAAVIVDGQHRLYGMADFAEEDLPILVVSLVDADIQEQAFQFIVINNKAVRVPTDNVKAIIADLDEDRLQARLLKAGVSYGEISPVLRDINDLESSPFQYLLKWPYNRDGTTLVPLTAIEQALRYMRSVFSFLEEDEDSLVAFFCAIWRAIKANYPDLWGIENTFMKKVNINALNEYIVERLKFAWELNLLDIFDSDSVERQVLSILELLPQIFWEADWSISIQDNANVRRMIKEDLTKLAENSRLRHQWNEDLELPVIGE